VGDHQWYISDFSDFEAAYPDWQLTFGIREILRDIHDSNVERWMAEVRGSAGERRRAV
jgi:CDP-paratose 2-epimerase